MEIVEGQVHVDTASHCDQVKDCIGAATKSHHGDHGVLERGSRHDVARLDVFFDQFVDRVASASTFVFLVSVFCGDTSRVRQGHAERFDCRGHRVGGIHATTGTGTRATAFDDLTSFFFGDLASDELSVALKGADDVKLFIVVAACLDCSAVDHDRRTIQPPHRDQAAWHVLVATRKCNQCVVPLATHDGFDRVSDQITTLQAEAHAFGAHRDAVADTDGVESHADQPCVFDTLLHFRSQIQQVHVAAIAFVPNTGDSDLRLVHVLGSHSRGVEHRLRSPLALGLCDPGAVFVQGMIVGRLSHNG